MPELPEVESLRRGLEKVLPGRTIKKIEIFKPKLVSGRGNARSVSKKKTEEFIKGLTGQKFLRLERRAKNLIFYFKNKSILVVHLKMTGQLVYKDNAGKLTEGGHPIKESEETLPNKQTRIIFALDKGFLYYNDTRQFGYLLYFKDEESLEKTEHFSKLGAEPLSKKFTPAYFSQKITGRSGVLKAVLMGQEVVVGLGNIYADEVCFASFVSPIRKTSSLKPVEIKNIYKNIKSILTRAIRLGGSSVSDYRLADGSRGNYAREHKVYGRSGENCFRCGKALLTILCAGRTTVYCTHCQK